ncbi:hypothetical protein Pint_05445 [Pistacia integerrima]|uniref:Uncharacterized protein n=1 Tax=Pistacia integerrima TaxID=434235 RepID=A0ACC0Z2W2_9ROSI|nr:hypothetical protein Pint_05445 [Pistacia integerrima]
MGGCASASKPKEIDFATCEVKFEITAVDDAKPAYARPAKAETENKFIEEANANQNIKEIGRNVEGNVENVKESEKRIELTIDQKAKKAKENEKNVEKVDGKAKATAKEMENKVEAAVVGKVDKSDEVPKKLEKFDQK